MTTILKGIVSIGLLTYLYTRVEIHSVIGSLQNLRGSSLALAWLTYFAIQFVAILRWRIMVQVQGYRHAYKRLAAFYFAGLFFNLFLPTSIGGDLSKCYYLADDRRDIMRAMTTILADRASGMFALLCIAAVALLRSTILIPPWMTALTVGGAVAMILGLLIPFLTPRIFRRFEMPYRYWDNPRFLATSLTVSFIIQVSVVLINILIGRAVGVVIPWEFYFVFTPLVGMASMMPISVYGLGVREGAYVYFLAQAGIDASQALAFAIIWLFLSTSTSVLGGIGWVLSSRSVNPVKA
jgi:glycosyltransferase 2 family protein